MFSTGIKVGCCPGLNEVLKMWVEPYYSYRCEKDSASCTEENKDPFSTGIEVGCCPGLKEVLKVWVELDNFYRCVKDSGNALEEVLDDKQKKKSKKSNKK